MPSETSPRSIDVPHGELEAGILALVAADVAPRAMWFDGGTSTRGWFGGWPDLVLEGEDPRLLDDAEARWRREPDRVWMGWLGYDWGADVVSGRTPRSRALPGLGLRRFPAALELEPGGEAWIHGDATEGERLLTALRRVDPIAAPTWPFGALRAELDPATYRSKVDAAKRFIVDGDTYQINLAQRFAAPWRTAPSPAAIAGAYAQLRSRSAATMGGLFAIEDGWVLSNSPETLLAVTPLTDGGRVARSWPIKGTIARPRDPVADEHARARLRESHKDAAEHVMIVDLVRNDLGMLARPGTVQAARVPDLVGLTHVHHLVTEVSAVIDDSVTLRDLVQAMFPGGSITGAPKRRTIEIIEQLEGAERGLYCGSLILLAPGGLRMSIAIRTACVDARGLVVHGGGGVVIDSDPESERLETIAKVSAFSGPLH